MNKSQKIKIDINGPATEKHLKIRLEQNIDFLEVLSLEIKTKDIYRNFNANYGVLIGRVIANNGIGIPNAKVSIFIPLSEEDESNSEVLSIYPYKTPRDKNIDGKRYNLLPRVGEYDVETSTFKPKQPFGSFPTKPEIITNRTFLNVYKKYYKFSTITNQSGDFMIFGAPIGLHTVHMSVDITDIGKYSMTPPVMVSQLGYSPNLFLKQNTVIKENNDLDDLPHIETQEISVDIKPFWGDTENFEIGITRQDFRIRAEIVNTFTIFGNVFTDNEEVMWGGNDNGPKNYTNFNTITGGSTEEQLTNLAAAAKKSYPINEQVFYYPNSISDDQISGTNSVFLDKTEYSKIVRGGDFALIIPCNRQKIIISESGNEELVDDSYPGGIYTEFRGFITLESSINVTAKGKIQDVNNKYNDSYGINTKIKIPQQGDVVLDGNFVIATKTFSMYYPTIDIENPDQAVIDENNENWKKQHKRFTGGKYYTISKFNPSIISAPNLKLNVQIPPTSPLYAGGLAVGDRLNSLKKAAQVSEPKNHEKWFQQNNIACLISNTVIGETETVFPYNHTMVDDDKLKAFFSNWMNFSIYLPNISHLNLGASGFNHMKTSPFFTIDFISRYYNPSDGINKPIPSYLTENYFFPNTQELGGGILDTSKMLRSDLHWTDFVEVSREDIVKINNAQKEEKIKNGFTKNDLETEDVSLNFNKYRNGTNVFPNDYVFNGKPSCPLFGGLIENSDDQDKNIYYFLGINENNCINFLFDFGLI